MQIPENLIYDSILIVIHPFPRIRCNHAGYCPRQKHRNSCYRPAMELLIEKKREKHSQYKLYNDTYYCVDNRIADNAPISRIGENRYIICKTYECRRHSYCLVCKTEIYSICEWEAHQQEYQDENRQSESQSKLTFCPENRSFMSHTNLLVKNGRGVMPHPYSVIHYLPRILLKSASSSLSAC